LFQQSLAILTWQFSAPQRDIGRSTASLAEVYLREKRYPEAADAFDRALTLLEQALGPESPELLSIMEHYAQLLRMRRTSRKPRAWKHG
jgi:tetratricopeptide (TPR) repeat protein